MVPVKLPGVNRGTSRAGGPVSEGPGIVGMDLRRRLLFHNIPDELPPHACQDGVYGIIPHRARVASPGGRGSVSGVLVLGAESSTG